MADTPGDIGGGGGTASTLCAISQADLTGTLGNLITRIEQLETAVSQMLGANVQAGQLSDLSQQVGWVYGITYMGIPGWIQTEYGTLIPPPGFTLLGSGIRLSDGNTYTAVVMDENGVLQFGFDQTGAVSGALPDVWNNAGKTATVYSQEMHLPSTSGTWSENATWTVDIDPEDLISVSTTEIIIQTAGWYHVTMMCPFNLSGAAGESILSLSMGLSANTGSIANDPNNPSGGSTKGMRIYQWSNSATNSYSSLPFTADRTFYLDAGAHLTVTGNHLGSGTGGLGVVSVALQYLKAA